MNQGFFDAKVELQLDLGHPPRGRTVIGEANDGFCGRAFSGVLRVHRFILSAIPCLTASTMGSMAARPPPLIGIMALRLPPDMDVWTSRAKRPKRVDNRPRLTLASVAMSFPPAPADGFRVPAQAGRARPAGCTATTTIITTTPIGHGWASVRAQSLHANGPALDEAGRRKPTPASETGPLPEVTVNAIASSIVEHRPGQPSSLATDVATAARSRRERLLAIGV